MKTYADSTRLLSSVCVAKDNLAVSGSNFTKAQTVLSLYNSEPISQEVTLDNNLSASCGHVINEARMLQNSLFLKILQKNVIQLSDRPSLLHL